MNQELDKVQEFEEKVFEAEGGRSGDTVKEAVSGAKAITLDRASQLWKTLLDHTGLSQNAFKEGLKSGSNIVIVDLLSVLS